MTEMLTIVFAFCQMEMIFKKGEINAMLNNHFYSFGKNLDELFLPCDDKQNTFFTSSNLG